MRRPALFLFQRGEHRRHAAGEAGRAHFFDSRDLLFAESGGAQIPGCQIGSPQALRQRVGASGQRRCRIVQFMRQSSRQLTERNQFFVVEIAGRKVTRTVNHDVDKYRGEFLAFSNHFRYVVAIYRDHLGRLFGHHISGRSNQPRIRHQTRNVPTAPFHDLPAPGPSIDVNAQVS